ncbi:MAG: hypothetical protein NC209_01660 [Alistipes sp.]|nr:hypothetical protein [Alistipes senegalensis]MCM1249834.1 hypothetical protein [Alistipes sp.]
MQVRIIDPIARGSFHEVFNAALLAMCTELFDRVAYHCHPSQRACVERMLEHHGYTEGLRRTTFRNMGVAGCEGPAGWVYRYAAAAIRSAWRLARSKRDEAVIFNYNNPFALGLLNLLNKFLHRRVVIVCHGELELLTQRHPWWRAQEWFGRILRRMFGRARLDRRIRFCVLGESILRNLSPYLSEANRPLFFAIDHPGFFDGTPVPPVPHDTLRVGTVGQLTPAKGLGRLLDLSRRISVPLTVVGRTYGFRDHAQWPDVRFVAGAENRFIPRERFEEEVAKLDYLLFAYDPAGYRLTASGAILDALNTGRPVITLRNDYFDDVLRLPVGHVVADMREMERLIDRLAAEYPAGIDPRFAENIVRLRREFAVETVAERLRQALEELLPELKNRRR